MLVYYRFVLLLIVKMQKRFTVFGASLLNLDRQENDVIYDSFCTKKNPRTEGWKKGDDKFKCNCVSSYSTIMTKEDKKPWGCKSPEEVDCTYHLGEVNKVYLIQKSDFKIPIFPQVNVTSTSISRISVWNFRLDWIWDYGHWAEITAARNFFSLDSLTNSSLIGSNVDLKKWKGQAIKFEFGDKKCVIAKFKGKIGYPLDMETFKKSIIEGMTTSAPVSTSFPLTTSTSRPTVTGRSAVSTRAKSTAVRIKRTTASRDAHKRSQDDNSKAPTIYLVVGIMIAGALFTIAAIFFIRRRKVALNLREKNTENDLKDIVIENKHPDMHRDVSQLVLSGNDYSSYPPSEKNSDVQVEDVECYTGVDDDTSKDPHETSTVMDAYSGMLSESSGEEEREEEEVEGEKEEGTEERETETNNNYTEPANILVHHYETIHDDSENVVNT